MDFGLGGGFFLGVLNHGGLVLNCRLSSYPVKPVSLELRGGIIVSENTFLGRLSGKTGFHLEKWEFSVGYDGVFSASRSLHAVEAGIGLHF